MKPAERRTYSGDIRFWTMVLAVAWTVVMLSATWWLNDQSDQKTLALAKTQAEIAFEKDVLYRRFNAMQGGLYARQSAQIPPNPYLNAIEERDLQTPSGRKLTLVNPAYMTRLVHELGRRQNGVQGHITSMNPIRPENAPDPWEKEALAQFEKGKPVVYALGQLNQRSYLRLMRPLVTEKPCLECHARQGYTEGSIRGGISVAVPMAPLWAIARPQKITIGTGIGLFWLLGLAGLGFGGRMATLHLQARQKANRHLQQSVKLKAIGTLAGGIAHDFNNINGIILGNAELAMDDIAEDHPARPFIEEIITAGLRAKNVVGQLSSFHQKAKQNRKPLNLSQTVTTTINLIASNAPAGIGIDLRTETEPAPVNADPDQIQQLVTHLCANAIDAMTDGIGQLTVRVANRLVSADQIDHQGTLPAGRYVCLTIADTGRGIAPEDMDRIFDPYFTRQPVGRGSGLGLAVASGIVKSHGAVIRVNSTVGKGTQLIIYFPAHDNFDRQPHSGDRESFHAITPNRILMVDDDKAVARLNQLMLEQLGYAVDTHHNPIQALDSFCNDPKQYDLVITDMTMPQMTGDRLIKEIRACRSDVPVVLCTGFADQVSEDASRKLGINAIAAKPMDKKKLGRTIDRVLGDR